MAGDGHLTAAPARENALRPFKRWRSRAADTGDKTVTVLRVRRRLNPSPAAIPATTGDPRLSGIAGDAKGSRPAVGIPRLELRHWLDRNDTPMSRRSPPERADRQPGLPVGELGFDRTGESPGSGQENFWR